VGSNSNIATFMERHARFVMLAKVESKDRQSVITALIKQARNLPKELHRSLTWDRGSEMAGHMAFTMATKINVCFCDPQSPWQRGSNENTNRLRRQYVPKGTGISGFSQVTPLGRYHDETFMSDSRQLQYAGQFRLRHETFRILSTIQLRGRRFDTGTEFSNTFWISEG